MAKAKIKWDDVTKIVNFIRVNGASAPLSVYDIYAAATDGQMVSNGISVVLEMLIKLGIVEESYEPCGGGRRQFLWLNVK